MSDFLWVEKYRPRKISECILTEDLKITFYNGLGQAIQPVLLGRNQYQINKQGIYFVNIQSKTVSVTQKIIVK